MGVSPAATAATRRVLLVHDSHEFGGMEVVILRSLEHLSASFEPAVLVRGDVGSSWTSPPELIDRLARLGVPVLRPRQRNVRLRVVQRMLEFVDLARMIRSWRPEVVHIHATTVEGAQKHTFAAWIARVAVILRTEHNSPSAFSRRPLDSRMRRLADPVTDLVITVSNHDRNEQIELVGRRADKVVCVHNGVDTDQYDPARQDGVIAIDGVPSHAVVVGTLGRISSQKGHRYLVEAAALVVSQRRDAHFVVVGDGELRGELEQRCGSLGISDNFHFIGHHTDVAAILARFDVGVMSSVHEGLSLALLEMMAMARPTVVTDHPGFTEAAVADVTSSVVPIADPRALADAILDLIDDRDKRERFGNAARERATTDFSFQRYMHDIEHLYRGHDGSAHRPTGSVPKVR